MTMSAGSVCISDSERLCVENSFLVFGWTAFEDVIFEEVEELKCFLLLTYVVQPSFVGWLILVCKELRQRLFLEFLLKCIGFISEQSV